MPPEPVVIFVADANHKMVPMATSIIPVKKIQGVPYSQIIKVLFDSRVSTLMISKKPCLVEFKLITTDQVISPIL